MKKIRKYYLMICFLFFIYLCGFLTIAKNSSAISKLENRTLAQKPKYSKELLLSGEYFRSWEEYLTDHIFGRTYWIKGYSFLNASLLKKHSINNIVIADNGTLLPFIPHNRVYDLDDLKNNINNSVEEISNLSNYINNYGGEFYFIGIPEQSSYLRDKYPSYYRNGEEFLNSSEENMFKGLDKNNINYINMMEKYKLNDFEEYYFKTDHHYTFRGAYKAYTEIIDRIINDSEQIIIREPLREEEIEFITLENPIWGSRNRSLSFIYPTDEKLEIGYPVEQIDYEKVTNGNADPEFYYTEYLEKGRPSYGVYMGGDHAETIITTDREELPDLLIFGDSFTNPLEPLLYYHFNQTRILDLRYYSEMSLYEYIEEYKPEYIIMVRDDLNYSSSIGNGDFN